MTHSTKTLHIKHNKPTYLPPRRDTATGTKINPTLTPRNKTKAGGDSPPDERTTRGPFLSLRIIYTLYLFERQGKGQSRSSFGKCLHRRGI